MEERIRLQRRQSSSSDPVSIFAPSSLAQSANQSSDVARSLSQLPAVGHDFSRISILPPPGAANQSETIPEIDQTNLKVEPVQRSIEGVARSSSVPMWGHDFSKVSVLPVQRKLTVSQPDDPYEQEADRVADQVMRMQIPESNEALVMQSRGEGVDRKCADCEEEELVQTKSIVQRSGNTLQAEDDLESRLSSSRGGGSPLPDEVRSFMEPRFGADFSQVRVHTESEAVQMNRDLNAQAFTHGQDIFFGVGRMPAKDNLTAHELTHVMQQGATAKNESSVSSKQRAALESTSVSRQLEETQIQRDAGATAGVVGAGLAALGILQNQVNNPGNNLSYSSDQVTYPKDLSMVPGSTKFIKQEIAHFFSYGAVVDNDTTFNLCGDFGKGIMANVRIELGKTTTYYTSALSFTAKALQTPYGSVEDPKIRFTCSGRFDPAGLGDCSYYVVLEIDQNGMVTPIEASIVNGSGDLTASLGGFDLTIGDEPKEHDSSEDFYG